MVPILQLKVSEQDDILLLRQRAKEIATLAGLPNKDEARFGAALLNVACHTLQYTGGGTIEFAVVESETSRQCLSATLNLKGPGIEDLETALNSHIGSNRGGTDGEINIANLVDSFSIHRQAGGEIIIRLIIALPATRPKADASVVREWLNTLYEKEPASAASILKQKNQDLMVSLVKEKGLRLALDDSLAQVSKLTKELEDTNKGILALYKEVDDKSIELMEKNKQLQNSQKVLELLSMQAQEATQTKSQFLAYMSHEIRTQMNAIIGIGDILSRSLLSAEQSTLLALLRDSGRALLGIINDILDFSKIEAGKLSVETIEFDLLQSIERTAELLNRQAKAKNLSLVTFIDPQIPRLVYGDSGRLRQILTNLIGNAIKFTEAGEIEICAAVQNKEREHVTVRFSINDTGKGIPKELRHKLFKQYTQMEQAKTYTNLGTGLGLNICKKLVELMNGEIGAQDREGNGSTFWFTLPFRFVNDANIQPFGLAKPLQAIFPGSLSLPAGCILLVEDNPTNQMVSAMQLKELGLTIDVAEDGRQAVEAISKNNYILIFMDCQMPVMDGYEATRRIREMETISKHHIPIVAMTANAVPGSKEKCLAAGMDEYICKPVSIEDMRAVLERCLLGQPAVPVKLTEDKDLTTSLPDTTSSTNLSSRSQNKLVDLQYLQKRFKPDQLRNIFNSFAAETEPVLNSIVAAIEARDAQALKAKAHHLTGSSATIHATVMDKLARQLEETADQLDWQATERLYHTLKESFLELKGILQECGIIESDVSQKKFPD